MPIAQSPNFPNSYLMRSATIVLAYLVRFTELSLTEAVRTVRQRRDIRPNRGFLQQLIQFEQKINKTSN